MAAPYKLRCQIPGHEKDVRAVAAAIFPEQGIISGSRDCTAKVWVPNEKNPGYHEGHVISGHSNFVAAVCVMPPDDKHPYGLIYTGSNDHNILAFTLDSPQPIYKLTGHTNTVCTLAVGKFGTLLSGSWDKTAKVWLGNKTVMTLEGHEAAIWGVAIMPEQGLMLTGSADKTIKLWKAGKCQNTFTGHEDCVRDVAVTQGLEFLSCSNDTTIRRWLISGECIAVYYGHTNFVYSIAVLPNGQDFVSSGEDRTLRVWIDGECKQTIPHPTMSIWCVCVLQSGDIVTGSSDGVLRVFTCNQEMYASVEEQQAFEDDVATAEVPTQVGDINISELPGPEALLNPGLKDGQTKMVRTDKGKVELYHWDAGESQWKKIGDVVGSGAAQKTPGKTLYEGLEYDYVFTVDIQEGKPPLKLPYNITEDPWFAAQKFLEKNELSQMFLDQVANFIVENTKGVVLGQPQAGYNDPFTGGNRYIPGQSNSFGTGGTDPFTGSGRYVPSVTQAPSGGGDGLDPFTGSSSYHSSNSAERLNTTVGSKFFPQKSLLTFDTANPTQIIGKLKEFNEKVGPGMCIEGNRLTDLESVIKGKKLTPEQLNTLTSVLSWPNEYVFPALDVLRLCLRSPDANETLCRDNRILHTLLKHLSADSPPQCQMLSLRGLCNMSFQPAGQKLCGDSLESVLSKALSCRASRNKNVQVALATLFLNYSVLLGSGSDLDGVSVCLSGALSVLQEELDPEALFRLLVCVGTLIKTDIAVKVMALSLGVTDILGEMTGISEPKKVADCLEELLINLR
ncbi:hypothetical protein ACJMK2_042263 [Sinanodonta woodiana]|uniref:Phospholipase A-2-activating protein n=1 Tax=Sinanodonta woodiana TaxID=1069815 RepID=A0ABD3W7T6_SINWO